jgi:hypothetical protein
MTVTVRVEAEHHRTVSYFCPVIPPQGYEIQALALIRTLIHLPPMKEISRLGLSIWEAREGSYSLNPHTIRYVFSSRNHSAQQGSHSTRSRAEEGSSPNLNHSPDVVKKPWMDETVDSSVMVRSKSDKG